MPIYEYKCQDCGEITELLVDGSTANSEIECGYCKSKNLSKLLSKVSVLMGKTGIKPQNGKTCCGRDERCEKPPCSEDGSCVR